MGKISGPLLDRFDLRIDVPATEIDDLQRLGPGEASAPIAARVAAARQIQRKRYAHLGITTNAQAEGDMLIKIAAPAAEAMDFLGQVARKFHLSARAYHRILRVARTIADLEGAADVAKPHIAEAVAYRIAGS